MSDVHWSNRARLDPLRSAQYDWDTAAIGAALAKLCAPDALFRLCHPFGDMQGHDSFQRDALLPLQAAWPDVERRDWIVMSGRDSHGHDWVGCAGHFMGTFAAPFLGIPPTGHLAHMRFHEFYRIVDGQIVEMQAIWDLPEVMMQAGIWPMAPSLGREFCVPGPASGDGLARGPRDDAQGQASCDLIVDMIDHMQRHPAQGGPEVMQMDRFWSDRMNWYGPAGIGTGRGVAGFRNWHQIPFLAAMPDRGKAKHDVTLHFFGDNNYAAVTGWPNMVQTITHDGWMGIAPGGQQVSMRSLDFWRVEAGKIRENWVLVDLLDVYRQLGVDVLARMGEFAKARVPGSVPFPVGVA